MHALMFGLFVLIVGIVFAIFATAACMLSSEISRREEDEE